MIRGEVQDEGRGDDPAEHQARHRAGHIGLDVTAERVRLAGGEFEIGSGPDQGTRARFAIPLGPPDDITATEGLDEPAPSPKASLHPRGAQGR